MIKVEIRAGVTKISGRNKGEWMLVPYWPASGRTIRKLARPTLSEEWIEEAAAFADAELSRFSSRDFEPHECF